MKKIISFILLTSFLLSGCGLSTSNTPNDTIESQETEPQKNITIKLGDSLSKDHPTVLADYEFARLVKENSNGRITVEVYPEGSLGGEKTVTEKVQTGEIEMERVGIVLLEPYYKDYAILALPYLFKDTNHMFRILESDICSEFLKPEGTANFVGLCWFDAGQRSIYTTEKVETLEQLKGLKIRVQNSKIMFEIMKSLGADPIAMEYSNIYKSLETDAIDGAENNYPSYVTSKQSDVCKYFLEDTHNMIPEMLIINKDFYNSLSKEDRIIIENSAKEAAQYQKSIWAKYNEKLKQEAIDNGTVIITLSPEEKSKFQEAVLPVYDIYAKDRADLLDDILAVD